MNNIEGDLMKDLKIMPKHPKQEVQAEIDAFQKLNDSVNKLKYQLREAKYNNEDTIGLENNIALAEKVRDQQAHELESKGVSTEGLKPNPEVDNVN